MIRAAALGGLLLLAACHRNQAALTPDADAETRNATAAKTLADLAAADEAARPPLAVPARSRIAVGAADPSTTAEAAPDDSPVANETPPAPQ